MTTVRSISGRLDGRQVRLGRVFRHPDRRALLIPLDHSFSSGPIGHRDRVAELVAMAALRGADGVILHAGRLRGLAAEWFGGLGLVLHLSGGTDLCPEAHAKVLVRGVDDALALGADAVSVHVNVGSSTELDQLRQVGEVAAACDRLGVPLLAMMYARGEGITPAQSTSADTAAHLAAIATDLGADIVKLSVDEGVDGVRHVVESSAIPVLVAGGPSERDVPIDAYARMAVAGGVAGLAVGRAVFEAADPGEVIDSLVAALHGDDDVLVLPEAVKALDNGRRTTSLTA
jgi:2-amino-4,5-dihydroxy-6-oxo-7-(phosphonooxy)heptanoate synthase